MFELIRQLVNLYGATGREAGVADAVEALVRDHVDSIRRDALGNLICEKRGTDPDGKRIMLSAHMDHIGFIVVAVEKEGYLRVMPVGGVGLAVSRTRHVSFQNGVQGVIVQEPVREGETPAMKHMFIDIGAADETEALSMVSLGDVAVYANDCFRLGEHRVAAPAMDDRIACVVLLKALEMLGKSDNDLYFVFTVQEELGLRGAKTAAYGIDPDYGVAVDVTWSDDELNPRHRGSSTAGGGASIKVMDGSVICHPQMVKRLEELALAREIPYQMDVIRQGGTDAGSIHLTRSGVYTGGVSIPCRYMHSPVEMVDARDVEACAGLVAAFAEAELE